VAFKLPFKLDKKTLALILSVLLNILGGTGTVAPPFDDPDPVCPPTTTVDAGDAFEAPAPKASPAPTGIPQN
jgi:hypothetical protein